MRNINSVSRTESLIDCPCEGIHQLVDWLCDHAPVEDGSLLMHTDFGVLWGHYSQKTLKFPSEIELTSFILTIADLPISAVQQLRLFGQTGEVYVWRQANALKARIWSDTTDGLASQQYFDEAQILWGTQVEKQGQDGFTVVSDGIEGLCHVVPIDAAQIAFDDFAAPQKQRPLRLMVRNYLTQNIEDGSYHVSGSRLVKLYATKVERGDTKQ